MSTIGQQPQVPPAAKPIVAAGPRELRIISHSALFYWWPVWVFGYLFAIMSAIDGSRAAIVPKDSAYYKDADLHNAKPFDSDKAVDPISDRNVVVLPKDGRLPEGTEELKVKMHHWKGLGVIYVAILFLVILITNIPLRGLASMIVIVSIMFIVLLFAFFGWWDNVFRALGVLAIHMNLGFYVAFSTLIFIVWAFATFVYDRMEYWVVRPGQLSHEYFFGGGERNFDTVGMHSEKLRDDLFRHLILGLGSGDMIIETSGARHETIRIPNVLRVTPKLRQLQQLTAEKPGDEPLRP